MSLDLSLWNIERGLVELMSMREEATDALTVAEASGKYEDAEEPRKELEVIDLEIKQYISAEIRKVDGIRATWKHLHMLEINATAEAELQHQRALAFRRNLDRLKETVREVMESMPWRPGKPKKLEGGTGSLLLKANGGNQAVVVSDPAIVPDEFCLRTVTVPENIWKMIVARTCWTGIEIGHPDQISSRTQIGPKSPSMTLIREALQKNCPECQGIGIDQSGSGMPCPACGGSGKQGVPGCSLAPRGSHVELK